MSACSTFTEHVWKPGECKNCFKPKSLHCAPSGSDKPRAERRLAAASQNPPRAGTRANSNLADNSQRSGGGGTARSGHFRPPVAKKPTIAVKPTMMLPCSSLGSGSNGIIQSPTNVPEPGKSSAFVVWNRNGLNCKRASDTRNNNEGEDGDDEIEGYEQLSPRTPSGNNNSGLTDVLKEIAGLGPGPSLTPVASKDLFWGRISSSYQRSLERGLPASSCLAMGSCITGGSTSQKRVSLSDSAEIISTEGGRFCYPEFSSEDEDDEEESERDDEHESWDESDEELLAMEIRMRGQPRFANFRAATLSPVPFAASKKWNTVPLRNRSLQRICAVDYDDSYDEILNGYPSVETAGVIIYGPPDCQGSGFLTNSGSTVSPGSSSSLPEDSQTASSSESGVSCAAPNGSQSPKSPTATTSPVKKESARRALSPVKVLEMHKAVLAIHLDDPDQSASMPQALPGQPVTISFSPTEEQAKPYRVVNLEKSLICKPYTVVDVSAAMTGKSEASADPKHKNKTFCCTAGQPTSPTSPTSPLDRSNAPRKKIGSTRYQEVWTSSTSPREKIPKVDPGNGNASGRSVPSQHLSHKSAPTSPVAGLSSSRTVPVKSPNLSEIKFNSFNNAGMPPFPIIIRDEPAYARSSKNAVKVPIVINPNAYDNLAVYKSFLGLHGELAQVKAVGSRATSHTYEEIGSSESVRSTSTDKTLSGRGTSERASSEETKTPSEAKSPNLQPSPNSNAEKSSPTPMAVRRDLSRDDLLEQSLGAGLIQKVDASVVLSQIVASIQPPQSPPDSPSAHEKSFGAEELYALPPDAVKETPTSLSNEVAKNTISKVLAKSQSASAAVPLSACRSEPNAPFPPPRSTSSPYHASNILQRHFGNWTKSAACSSPLRSGDGETRLNEDAKRNQAETSKPKRWISFKSFFRRRKDDDEKTEKEKEKGKLVGLDGTVIHMLPPPPVQQRHWFSEAKAEDPSQKPTIVFTYKMGRAEGEECKETALLTPGHSEESGPLSPGRQAPAPEVTQVAPDNDVSQLAAAGANNVAAAAGEQPAVTPLPARVNLGLVLGEARANRVASAGSEHSASLGEPEDDANRSHSPASSQCSATYSNLGQSRANMIPLKQPRSMKASNDTLASIDLEGLAEQPPLPPHNTTPPPLPKKAVPRSVTEPGLAAKEHHQGGFRPRAEAKPGGTNLSVANPLYDLDTTWETASQSSSVGTHDQESGDSLERPSGTFGRARPANSTSSMMSQASSATGASRERKVYPSTESLAGKNRKSGQGAAVAPSKHPRPALYRGLDSWDEVVGRIRGLHADTLRKLTSKCEDRFMAGQKDHLRFETDSWSDFRLTAGKPCCEAGDAVYYTASYSKDPLVNYAIKICRSKVKETQQQFFHSLAVRQSLALHFNIQQDCGHFLADVPSSMLPWEEEDDAEEEEEQGEDEKKEGGDGLKERQGKSEGKRPNSESDESSAGCPRSRVVVITREVPFQTVADFVRQGVSRHTQKPQLYERQVCLLLLQLCSGLEHMKPYHVTHCDLRLENLLLVHCRASDAGSAEPNNNGGCKSAAAAADSSCPARLIISNFSQAKQKSALATADPGALREHARLAPEIITATQFRKCDEFQTGILIYEMLHRPNPFEEMPELKEQEYTWADLPALPVRSVYSQGLQQLARLLLTVNPSERIRMSEARACLQCLLWGPREDLFQALGCIGTSGSSAASAQRQAILQNWLDLKRTLMMIKFAERSMDSACGVSLEDWLCCQYLAFASTESLSRVVHVLQQPQPPSQNHNLNQSAPAGHNPAHLAFHQTQSQPL
ncbi:inactive tyrosine-protein kinase PEAK1 [Syngnathus acus]|uniref:inactive tyrosine-protein kinase PEAK1 n=1 Tax=Syngnathus acus TaxID=161584 RepID=UPI001885C58D|nr:inactive tyrosine-protein kinase PEAK1 [Syngnathus acus]XP_037109954.1 inactive tyrosine-protein kinase PEAK1 [Syngnathus acus]